MTDTEILALVETRGMEVAPLHGGYWSACADVKERALFTLAPTLREAVVDLETMILHATEV